MYQLEPKHGNRGLILVGYPVKNSKTDENEFTQKIRQTAEEYGYTTLLFYLHPPGEDQIPEPGSPSPGFGNEGFSEVSCPEQGMPPLTESCYDAETMATAIMDFSDGPVTGNPGFRERSSEHIAICFAISYVMEAPEYAGKGTLNDAADLLSEDIDYVTRRAKRCRGDSRARVHWDSLCTLHPSKGAQEDTLMRAAVRVRCLAGGDRTRVYAAGRKHYVPGCASPLTAGTRRSIRVVRTEEEE